MTWKNSAAEYGWFGRCHLHSRDALMGMSGSPARRVGLLGSRRLTPVIPEAGLAFGSRWIRGVARRG
jgi:hypothetical protein